MITVAPVTIRILHLEDSARDGALVRDLLAEAGVDCTIVQVTTREQFEVTLDREDFDLVLCDYNLPGYDGFTALAHLRTHRPEWPVIVLSGSLGEDEAVQCLHLGATDYVLKQRMERFVPAVRRALQEAASRRRNVAGELELRASEERFRATFEQAAVGMAHVATNGRFLRVNGKLCAILGYSREELMGLDFGQITVDSDVIAGREALRTMVAGERDHYATEKRYRRRDGTIVWVSLNTNPVRDAAGRPDYFISVLEDITSRKLAEFRLRRINRLHAVLSKVSEAIPRTSDRDHLLGITCRIAVEDGGLAMAFVAEYDPATDSVRCVAAHGRTGDHLDTITIAADGPLGQGTIGTALRTGAPDVCNDFLRDPRMAPWCDSARRHGFGAVAAFPLRCAGAVVGALALFAEEPGYFEADEIQLMAAVAGGVSFALDALHTEARQREVEAKSAQQATLLDQARDAILARTLDDRITFWNQGAERLYGWTAAEAVGRSVRDLLYPDAAGLDAAMHHLAEHGEWSGEQSQRTRDGRPLTIEARWTLVRDESGWPVSVLCINTDITDRKIFEQQSRRGQRMESIGTLAGGIAHELNNLLAPIVMGAGLLRELEPSGDGRNVIENIERNARRGAELLRQVMAFAHGVEGERVRLLPGQLVREVESVVARIFPRNIAFEQRLPDDLWPVVGDPTQLQQVLLNLCVNARDAMPHGGRLAVTAYNRTIDDQYAALDRNAVAGRHVCIEVSDTGRGIPHDCLDRIFDPFFTTKEPGQGTGLGLSTVLGIVRSHGGFVEVASTPGKGSVFRIHLPAQAAEDDRESRSPASPPLPRGHGELVLVVDDETSVLDVTRRTLETFGYRVLTAEDGAQAIGVHALHRAEIAVVLTDMMMPVMDGPALIRALQRNAPDVRIIAASGLDVAEHASRATGAGVRTFLAKPYTAETLLSALDKAIHSRPSGPPFTLP